MKTSNKLRRVGVTLAALVVTLVMTITSTYAWFTTSANPSVSGLDFTVTSGGSSLLVAYAGSSTAPAQASFKTDLAAADFDTLLTTLGPTSSDISNFKLGAYALGASNAIQNRDGTSASAKKNVVDNTTGGYLEFYIHFLANSSVTVAFDDTKAMLTVPETPVSTLSPVFGWATVNTTAEHYGTGITLATTSEIYTSAAYAARMSFAPSGTDASARVWNPSANASSYITDTRTTYATGRFYVFKNITSGLQNFAVDYYNHIMPGTDIIKAASYVGDTDTMSGLTIPVTTSAAGGYYTGYVKIIVWLDGWDANCTNSMLKDTFTAAIGFKIA